MTTTIAITGTSGFIGSALLETTRRSPELISRAIYRRLPDQPPADVQSFAVGDLENGPDLSAALSGVDVLVHLAARAHVVDEEISDPSNAYHQVNVVGTQRLLDAAIAADVKRFVFLSSVTVHGESTDGRIPYTEADTPRPTTAYGVSKLEAETCIRAAANDHPIEIVILRPPLVYGPGVKGNMLRLIRLIKRGIPLPLGSVSNLRSMIGIENLVSAILAASLHPAAAGRTFLLSDQNDISTPDLVRTLAGAIQRPPRLFPVPDPLLRLAGQIVGRSGEVRRLTQSLVVDSRAMTETTGWGPLVSPEATLTRTARQVASQEQ